MTTSKQFRGFDFHCHVDLHPRPLEVIARCEQEQVIVMTVTTTPKAWPQNYAWTIGNKYVYSAVGLHPELAGERSSEIELLEQGIGRSRLVGEVGLDGSSRHQYGYEKQIQVFTRALDAAQHHGGRVLSIHSRRAERDVIRMIEERSDPSSVLCILHWFSGSMALARQAIKTGCYFSVNSAMLSHDRGRTLVRALTPERLLTETDAPFAKVLGRQLAPWDVLDTAHQIATVTGKSVQEITDQIAANAQQVFRFAGMEIVDEGSGKETATGFDSCGSRCTT